MLEVHDSMGPNPIGTTNGCVAQRQEANDSKSLQCGFESHRIYHFVGGVAQQAEATDLKSVKCESESHHLYQMNFMGV